MPIAGPAVGVVPRYWVGTRFCMAGAPGRKVRVMEEVAQAAAM